MNENRHRVKLYSLNDKRVWDDKGTGHVTPQNNQAGGDAKEVTLIVNSEIDASILLHSKISQDILYQRQQDTLIVWTDDNGCDVALSFQEKEGRDDIWNKICEVQGKDPDATLEDYDDEDNELENELENDKDIKQSKSDMFAEDEDEEDEVGGKKAGGDGGASDQAATTNKGAKKRVDTPRKNAANAPRKHGHKQLEDHGDTFDFIYENGTSATDPGYLASAASVPAPGDYDQLDEDDDDKDDFVSALERDGRATIGLSAVSSSSTVHSYLNEGGGAGVAFSSYFERSSASISAAGLAATAGPQFYNATSCGGSVVGAALLPPCDLAHLPQIAEVVAEHVSGLGGLGSGIAQANRRERLASALETQAYIPKLLQLFRTCEDLEHTEGLHHMYYILKNLFLLNRNAVLELLVADDVIVDVIGCLEYDPSLAPATSPDHALGTTEPALVDEAADKIFIAGDLNGPIVSMEIDLAAGDQRGSTKNQSEASPPPSDSPQDTPMSAPLSEVAGSDYDVEVYFNDVEALERGGAGGAKRLKSSGANHKRNHREYILRDVKFREAVPITNQELLRKIHQTYRLQYIQDVIFPQPSLFEENVLSSLTSFIFFNKLEIVNQIQDDEPLLTELFNQLTSETSTPAQKRNLILFLKEFCTFSQTLQTQSRDTFLKTIMNRGILSALEGVLPSDDEATRNAIVDIIWYLVEFSPSQIREYILKECETNQDEDTYFLNLLIEQMICDPDPELSNALQISLILKTIADPENMIASINKNEKTDFLSYFYKYNMHVLTAPLFANTTSKKPTKDDYRTAHLLSVIVEILSFYVSHHTFHSKNYFINKDLLRRVLVLMQSKHHFLVLCALRLMRQIINLKDEFYNRHIVRGHLFQSVVEAFVANGDRYNLLNSAILELFDFIYMEDLKLLLTHVVENYHDKYFGHIAYVDTFKKLKTRYAQHVDSSSSSGLSGRANNSSIYYSSTPGFASTKQTQHQHKTTPGSTASEFTSKTNALSSRIGQISTNAAAALLKFDELDDELDDENDEVDELDDEEEEEKRKEEMWFETDEDDGNGLLLPNLTPQSGEVKGQGVLTEEGENSTPDTGKEGLKQATKPDHINSAPTVTLAEEEIVAFSPSTQTTAKITSFKNSFSTVPQESGVVATKKYIAPQISFSLQPKPRAEVDAGAAHLKKAHHFAPNPLPSAPSLSPKTKQTTQLTLPPLQDVATSSNKAATTLPSLVDYPDEDSDDCDDGDTESADGTKKALPSPRDDLTRKSSTTTPDDQ